MKSKHQGTDVAVPATGKAARATGMSFAGSHALRQAFHTLIPGGSHTYAKGDDQFPELMAPYIVRGDGCRVWDVDGNEFIEYGMGLRAVTLGHSYRPVLEAATRQMALGTNFVRPSPIELECAEELLGLIPGAEMAKFSKNGSDVTSAAVRLSRAYTGRDLIALCADHPFFSIDDWFIGTTSLSSGIPDTIRALTVKFRYNDLSSLKALFDQHPGRIACVIMEPEKETPPADGFLQKVRRLCNDQGTVLVFDEMITGFRWHLGGAQTLHGVTPDLSTFGKGMSNGFSASALVGKRDIMRLGGLEENRKRVFLLSLTHGAETHALAAALETMRTYRREPVLEHLWGQGTRLAAGIEKSVAENRLADYFQTKGRPCCLTYSTKDVDKKPSQAFRTLFLQETIKRGLLAPSFVVSYAHTDGHIDKTLEIVHESLVVYKKAMTDGIGKYLVGRPVRPVFREST